MQRLLFCSMQTTRNTFDQQLRAVLEPVIAAAGFQCVELQLQRSRRARRLAVIVYRADGMSAAALERLTRQIQFHLPLIGDSIDADVQDLTLEVSSPGIERALRLPHEYAIFVGKAVRILRTGSAAWEPAVIAGATGGTVTLQLADREETIPVETIRRAQLTGAERGST